MIWLPAWLNDVLLIFIIYINAYQIITDLTSELPILIHSHIEMNNNQYIMCI